VGAHTFHQLWKEQREEKKLNRRKKFQKMVEDKLLHILVLWQKLVMSSSYLEKKNLQFEFWLFFWGTFNAMVKIYNWLIKPLFFGVHTRKWNSVECKIGSNSMCITHN
jgi:hypothetical protein